MNLRRNASLAAFALTVGACAASTAPPTTPVPTVAPITPVLPDNEPPDASEVSPAILDVKPGIPDVDQSLHSVPLDEVYFDTFDGGSVQLSRSTLEVRRRLFDTIKPIDDPPYGNIAAGDWLADDDLVIGFVTGKQAYAYPIKILNFHEIVNDEFNGVPVLISYCPLCFSGVVYDRRVDGNTLTFSNTSALYESDLVMVDRETGSYWWQVAGESIVGTLTGSRLTSLPSVTTTWSEWALEYPDTLIMTRDVGPNPERYTRDPFVGYAENIDNGFFIFPVGEAAQDPRLTPATLVIGVELGGIARAYPIEFLGLAATSDNVGGVATVLFTTGDGTTGAVFSAVLEDGTELTFSGSGSDFVDDQTGSTWNVFGRALSGPLAGTTLIPLPSRSTFWFAYVGAFPDAEVFSSPRS